MAIQQNRVDALVYAVHFEAAKSVSGWANHKVRTLTDCDDTND